jgi:Ca2+-transporting ATPase
MSHVWQAPDGRREFVIAAKGAPEAIADLCNLGPADVAALAYSVNQMAAEGLRVLGVAQALWLCSLVRLGRTRGAVAGAIIARATTNRI